MAQESQAYIKKWAKAGVIPGTKVGREWVFFEAHIREFMQECMRIERLRPYVDNASKWYRSQFTRKEWAVMRAEEKARLDYVAPPPKPASFYTTQRKAAKMLRTPQWADHDAIAKIYRECDRVTRLTKIAHHVDHIVPLQGRNVSGLHVENNLQILTATENVRKHNLYDC